jgi:subtilisin family serine protease
MKAKLTLTLIFIPLIYIFAQDSLQSFLTLSGTGVENFVNSHPQYDGRGTIIFILDTGVDMSVDGLRKTSTGETKVIDVQDFTGEGDVKYYDAEVKEDSGKYYFVNEQQKFKVAGADKLSLKSSDGKYYIGALEESLLKDSRSGIDDLNGNGKTNDKYYFVLFQTKEGDKSFWVAYFDTNDNGDLSDEKPIRSYKENHDYFQIGNENGLPKVAFAVNIFPAEKKISLFFDDGGHGTHVAGIAAGYHIGQTYLNGIAPGAKIIALKIGNNQFSGGATVTESMKKAYLYADMVSKERKEPCILNMSFGIGSEIEGQSDMGLFLDSLLKANHYLYVCIANGNDGPGISSSGLPASSKYVFSSGAVLPHDVGRDLLGTTLDRDIIFYFSSRGGEVSKPDICSPGMATSTIPNWAPRNVMAGTSMASPYTAGIISLLMSAMIKEYPDLKIPSQLIFKAIRNSATEMKGYTSLDEGYGYINVDSAYALLKKYITLGEVKNLETYSFTSFAPNMPDGSSQNYYLRNGLFLNGNETHRSTLSRDNYQNDDTFYRIYDLKSSADWLIPIQKKIYLRNNQSSSIYFKFNKKKLTAPGLYVGKIIGSRDDKTRMPEFQMLATVIIPNQFNQLNNFSRKWSDDSLEPGMVKRYFILVPSGFSAAEVTLSAVKNKFSDTMLRLFDPNGADLYSSAVLNTQDNEKMIPNNFYDLHPGVYELDVVSSYRAGEISYYNLSVNFTGITMISSDQVDSLDKKIEVVSSNTDDQNYYLNGKILGYTRDTVVTLGAKTENYFPFTILKGERSIKFTVNMDKEDFNKVTDFSLLIYDKEGITLSSFALHYKGGSITVDNNFYSDTTNLKLRLVPAFTNSYGEMKVHINEEVSFNNPVGFNVTDSRSSFIRLYPGISKSLDCQFSNPDVDIPPDAKFSAKIYFESSGTGNIDYELPINLSFLRSMH